MDKNALRAEIVRNGKTQAMVAKYLGISEKTFSVKMNRGKFGVDEAEKMIDYLGIEQPGRIFFTTRVS